MSFREQLEGDLGCEPVHYRKVFLDDDEASDEGGREDEASLNPRDGGPRSDEDYQGDDRYDSEESYHYSDDHEDYSDDSEPDADTIQHQTSWCEQNYI